VTYSIQRAADLGSPTPFATIQSNIISRAATTSYTDPTATNGDAYFYRVGVQ